MVSSIHKLPAEVNTKIIGHLKTYADVLCIALTNRYFFDLSVGRLHEILVDSVGPWAGGRILCLGDYADDLPSQLWSPGKTGDQTMEHWNSVDINMYNGRRGLMDSDVRFKDRNPVIYDSPEFRFINSLAHDWLNNACPTHLIRLLASQKHANPWILRNLTKREYLSTIGIARFESDVNGPFIRGPVTFGECLIMKTCWSADPSVSMRNHGNLHRGDWAGDRFDIVPMERFERDRRSNPSLKWKDVSTEIRKEMVNYAHSERIKDYN